ncbi:MAG: DUF3416 domain-containing protein, partial [Rhodospirillales bacterium]|nr:DUF3416 domain-containing protein [Acetobacter sp.]
MAERNSGRKAPSGKTAVLEENRGTELPKAPEPDGRQRVLIEGISPEIDGGRFPVKRTVGDLVQVQVDLFTDGHDSITAALLYRHEKNEGWTEVPFTFLNNDRWFAEFTVTELGRYRYRVIAWVDHFFTWRKDLLKRIDANTDTTLDYQIGANLIAEAAERATPTDKRLLQAEAEFLREDESEARRERGTAAELNEAMLRNPDRGYASDSGKDLVIVVDPVRARFSSWYEFFPRSASTTEGQHGTFRDCEARLPYVAEMGFDVLYFPPIHPIGTQFRKGRNNTTTPEPGDVGSPWAIGAVEG